MSRSGTSSDRSARPGRATAPALGVSPADAGRGASRRRSDQALISLAEAISAGLGPQDVLNRVVAAAATLTDGATVHLWLVGDDREQLHLAASHGERVGRRGVPLPALLRIDEGIPAAIARSRATVVVVSCSTSRRFAYQAWVRDQGLASFAGVPFALGDRLLGVLGLFTARRHEFTPYEVDLLRSFANHAAVALENAALLEASTRRLRRLEALREIEGEIQQQRDPEVLLALIGQRAAEFLGGDAAAVYLLEESTGLLRPHAWFGVPKEAQHIPIAIGRGAVGATANEGKGMVVNDYPRSPFAIAPFDQANHAVATQPLRHGEIVEGVIAVTRTTPNRPFHRDDLIELGDFAVQASIALENARLLRLASARADRMKAAAEVGQLLASTRDADHILDLIAEKCREILHADGFGFFRLGPDGRLRYLRGFGLDPTYSDRLPLEVSEGVIGRATRERRAVVTRDVLADPALQFSLVAHAGAESQGRRAIAAVPLLVHDQLLGALAVFPVPGFDLRAEDVEFLETLASHAAAALENARLFAELHRAYDDLKATQEQLVQAEKLRALGEMASGVAHDFNNALAAILGRVQLIQRRVEDPTARQWLQVVERAAHDASQTVRRIQEFTRIRRDLPTETVDVNQAVGDAIEITRARWQDEAQSHGVAIQVVPSLETVPPVDGQAGELRQVLTNLILNAVDAMPEGGTISITTRMADGAVEIGVRDTGVGMSEEVRRRVFEPFFSTKGARGTGLGLAMVYGLVSRHGGEVTASSKEGAGATFTIRLPAGRGVGAASEPEPDAVRDVPARVLVIDDEPEVCATLADMLRVGGHEVVVTHDGTDGLARFQAEPFDVVMTDLAMPGLSGWEVAQNVKAIRPTMPIILVTGWGEELPAEQLRARGIERVLAKPFELETTLRVVAAVRAPASPALGSPSTRAGGGVP